MTDQTVNPGTLTDHDRGYTLIRQLAIQIRHQVGKTVRGRRVTDIWDTLDRRGFGFEVEIVNEEGRPTGHVASVRITLDRIEVPPPPPVKRKKRLF